MPHVWTMGNFFGADVEYSRRRDGDHRERDSRYSEHRTCYYCSEWIKNVSKTCKAHQTKYETEVRQPAKRLHSLLSRISEMPGDEPIIGHSDLLRLIQLAEESRWLEMYAHLALVLERSL